MSYTGEASGNSWHGGGCGGFSMPLVSTRRMRTDQVALHVIYGRGVRQRLARGRMRWILRDDQPAFCSRACKGAACQWGSVPRGRSIYYITTSIQSSYDISCTTSDDYREVGASIQAHSMSGKVSWTLFMTAFGPRVSVA